MNTHHRTKSGYSLLTTLFIMTALSMTLGMLITIGRQRVFTANKLTDRVKALAYAEAGIDFAYAILSADFEQRNNPSAFSMNPSGSNAMSSVWSTYSSGILSSYGDGSFAITLTPISNRYVVVNSEGKCGSEVREAEVVVDDIFAGSGGSDATDYSSMEGFNYAILSGGQFDFKGSGYVAGSQKMHSNSAIVINGSAKTDINMTSTVSIQVGKNTIEGSIEAPLLNIHPKADITGASTTASVPPVAIPDIDLTPYFNWAKDHGEVYVGDFSSSSSYSPNGGIMYVIGDVEISSHAVISGSIIATGNIHITGAAEITPNTSVFAMATESGDLENTSSGTIEGLVYSKKGNYKQTANGTLKGQIIVGGDVQKGGNSDIILYVQSIPTPPGGVSVTPTKSLPLISAWQK
jgi:hypothetical protein